MAKSKSKNRPAEFETAIVGGRLVETGTVFVNGFNLGPGERDPATGNISQGPQVTARAEARKGEAVKKRYSVSGVMTISVHVEVDATSAEEAVEIAGQAPVMTLCAGCASSGRGRYGEWRTSGELDGEPEDLTAEKIENAT